MKKIKENNSQHLYEVNCLVGLRNSERITELAKKIEDWIEKKKGELIEVEKAETPESKGGKGEVWVERKRLAYPINKDKAGYYINSWIKLDPADVNDLKRFLKLEKEIVRFAILAEDKIAKFSPNREAVILDEVGQLASQQPPKKYPERKETFHPAPSREVKEEKKETGVSATESVETQPSYAEAPAGKHVASQNEEKESKILKKPISAEVIETKDSVIEGDKKEKKVARKAKVEPKAVVEEAEKEEIEEVAVSKKEVIKESETKTEEKKTEVLKQVQDDKKEEEKSAKHKKITLEELDQRLDDILNEDIL